MVSFEELSEMAITAFRNGLRLHGDSVILFDENSYPSAVLLSVLAMEEFGKYFMLSAYVFYSRVGGKREEKFENKFLKYLYNHKSKQRVIFGRDGFYPSIEELEKVDNNFYEFLKQRSTYVGYDRKKGNLLLDKGFNNPIEVTDSIAES